MVICNNISMLIKYYFSNVNEKIDYELSKEDEEEIYNPDFYCGCSCCYLTTQWQLFLLRPLKVLDEIKDK
jgi:hypothetical protein